MKIVIKNTIIYGLITVAGFLLIKNFTPFTLKWMGEFLISLTAIIVFLFGIFGLLVTYFHEPHSGP